MFLLEASCLLHKAFKNFRLHLSPSWHTGEDQWLLDLRIFWRVRLGRVGLGRGLSLFLGRIGWTEGFIDRSVGWQSHPLKREFFESVCQWILFGVGQWILFGVSSWHLVWEATWFLHDSQLCGNPKLNHAATQNARVSIEQWLLTQSCRPAYHWKAERIRNLFYI